MATKELITIGIDPGKKYACAIMHHTALSISAISLTDTQHNTLIALRGVLSTIKDLSCINVWIEDVGAMAYTKIDKETGKKTVTSQKGSSNFGFGKSTGWFYGLFDYLDIKLNTVAPKVWLNEFRIPARKKPSDIPYFQIVRDMYPGLTAQGEFKYKTKHHDKAAALLIAEYGRRHAVGALIGYNIKRIETVYSYEQIERL